MSENQTARLLKIKWETVSKKAIFLGLRAERWHKRERMEILAKGKAITRVQFDEMETFEHTKCKPLSIPLLVTEDRRILGVAVASMPANGRLAQIAMNKYGPRADDRRAVASALLKKMTEAVSPTALITSDQNPKYPSWIRPHFKEVTHIRIKGRKPRPMGLGELKVGAYDPIFALNHTAAMFRANVNRLFRRTWCTTKVARNLELRLWLYAQVHNERLA